jgi:hypothetical protein
VEDYIKPSSTSRRSYGFHSLSSIVAKLQSPRSLSLATRTQKPFWDLREKTKIYTSTKAI